MCGIAGIFSSSTGEITRLLLRQMADTLRHRGPDDEGYLLGNTNTEYYVPAHGENTVAELKASTEHLSSLGELDPDFALCHRRLSILDLTPAGHQPMSNEDGTIWIVYNGEIYNHLELARELKNTGHRFSSRSDTEVILHGYEQWGEDCLNRFNGMWAFAIWDSRKKKLFCSRDRFGIKPFYYYFDRERFIFASEIKAILAAAFVERKPDTQTIFDFLAYSLQDCTADTFFENIHQLRGGHFLTFDADRKRMSMQRYYNLPIKNKEAVLSDDYYSARFRRLFEESISLQLISDVPVGSCLSGGLDSSSIVCMIDRLMRHNGIKLPGTGDIQKTFSAKFHEREYDESYFINKVVEKTGVDAHEVYSPAESVWEDLPSLLWHQDEPCASSYVGAQWRVYRLAKQTGVTVLLDGQGGDELVAGYTIYISALLAYLLGSFQLGAFIREAGAELAINKTAGTINILMGVFHLLPEPVKEGLRKVIHTEGNTCLSKDFVENNVGYYQRNANTNSPGSNIFDNLQYQLFTNTNLSHLLRDLDKNSMAHSVESRPAFLDYRLVEFTFSLPWDQKIRNGTRKYILRNAMKGILPDPVAARADKVPFPSPARVWLQQDLADKALDIINSKSFRERGYFDMNEVKREFNAFRHGNSKKIGKLIWRWINLELWHRIFIDERIEIPHNS